MYREFKIPVALVLATIALAGCGGQQGSKIAGPVPAAEKSLEEPVPAPHIGVAILQPVELEKTDYRFRMIGGPYKVTSSNPNVDVVVNKHGVDPHQIDIQPSRYGSSVARAVITVTNERTEATFQFTVVVQK